MTLIVGKVGRIILPFSSQIDTRDLGRDFGGSLVGAHEEGSTVGSGVAAGSSLELVLELANADLTIGLCFGNPRVGHWPTQAATRQ